MKSNLMIQIEGNNCIADNLIIASERKPKKLYFFMGSLRETGFDILESCLIDCKAKKHIVIGVDKKNTTKKMLEGLYKYTKNVYVYINNGAVELDSNIAIFEYDKTAEIFCISGNGSKGGFEDNLAIYTKLEYNLGLAEDKKDYEEYVNRLLEFTKMESFKKLEKEYIVELVDSKEIFSNKQYTHNIMSIADLAKAAKDRDKAEHKMAERGNTENTKEVEIDEEKHVEDNFYDEDAKISSVKAIDLADMSFDIDVGVASVSFEEEKPKVKEEKVVKKEKVKKLEKEEIVMEDDGIAFDPNSTLDLENILFNMSDVKLDTRKIDRKEQKERMKINKELDAIDPKESLNKKIDLNKVSNIVMEISSKPSKGRDVTAIKIPNYIKEMVPNFFEAMDSSLAVNKKDGLYKESEISVEIVDVANKKKYTDVSAVMSSKIGQTYISIMSDMMTNVDYEEGDIVRLIKLSKEIYHIEIISKNSEEFKVWKKMCTQKLRGADRQYGVM